MSTVSHSLSLDDVKQQFNDWRSQRGKIGSFPEELWRAAVALLQHYNASDIIRELRITKQQLDDRKNRYQDIQLSDNAFVDLEVTNNIQENRVVKAKLTQQSIPEPFSSGIELRKPDGTTLIINELPRQELHALVTTFMG